MLGKIQCLKRVFLKITVALGEGSHLFILPVSCKYQMSTGISCEFSHLLRFDSYQLRSVFRVI